MTAALYRGKGIFALVLVLFALGLFIADKYTGLAVYTSDISVTKEINFSAISSAEYPLFIDGILKGLSIDGQIAGKARVYLDAGNKSYLVYDNSEEGLLSGYATIPLNGGGSKPLDGIFRFDVSSNRSGEKVCVRWSVNSYEMCNGDFDCCALLGLSSSGEWNDSLYLTYERYGSSYENEVRAVMVFANYSLDPSNAYSDVSYSDEMLAYAVFEPFVSFTSECLETCLLPSLNYSEYVLRVEIENGSLDIDSIHYVLEEEIPGHMPVLVKPFENITIIKGENVLLNLSAYFSDEDNDITLFYSNAVENVSISVYGDVAVVLPANFTGVRYVYFSASDGYYTTTSNIFEIKVIDRPVAAAFANVTISEVNPEIRINEPVRWVKRVDTSSYVSNLSLNISSDALNVSVYTEDERLSDEKVTVVVDGVEKEASTFIAEKKIGQIEKMTTKLIAKKEEIIQERPTAAGEIASINKELSELSSEKNKLTGHAVVSSAEGLFTRFFEWLLNIDITGYAVKENEDKDKKDKDDKDKPKDIEVIIEEPVSNVTVEYYTEAPISTEIVLSATVKQIVVSSDVHYENITAFTNVTPETISIRLYRLVNEIREEAYFDRYDNNNNSLTDYIEWVVPSLSNQTYELVIEITKAEHLDENRAFVDDVYDYVKVQDDNWTLIPSGDYLRVTFEENLTAERDITIYARDSRIVNDSIMINGTLVPLDAYQKKMRLDEIRRMLANG